MRSLALFTITSLSFVLTAGVIGNAYYQKKQFYPSVVYITRSSPSMAVIYVQALILVFILGKIMRKFFFGQLRAAEYEHLMERSWYAVTETCLAFTVFRDDFTPKFVALFTVLLFLKSFHWLAEDRVDFLERSPFISWIFHLRVSILLVLLGILDEQFVEHAYQSTITKGASVQLVFGFEYAILLTVMVNITIKYILHTIDQMSENPWENKAVFLLYTELVMGFIKVILYLTFVAIMIRLYTLPLFAFRPMYYTMRAFKKAFNDVILSRRAIQNMNSLYPDATPEELAAADNVCIICREEMPQKSSLAIIYSTHLVCAPGSKGSRLAPPVVLTSCAPPQPLPLGRLLKVQQTHSRLLLSKEWADHSHLLGLQEHALVGITEDPKQSLRHKLYSPFHLIVDENRIEVLHKIETGYRTVLKVTECCLDNRVKMLGRSEVSAAVTAAIFKDVEDRPRPVYIYTIGGIHLLLPLVCDWSPGPPI
ncbi:hypothetical protein J437_LFUL017168 [Ladona fulva]|uniref:E3 ubiquitin-protein ligase synoviolin-like TPR repeats domain-containing protein n=1 Tax=Ladona fulva TaxID=123851 RepID=A0A8K0P994_LADFU|nr:hypothetical protein J437_LFUL017168 [Ladona fulva]